MSALLDAAIVVALSAHKDRFSLDGSPEVLHPLSVLARTRNLLVENGVYWGAALAAAVLHDTVEDTVVTLGFIRSEFGNEIADAVDSLTRRDGEPYHYYILRAKANRIGTIVKFADLEDNLFRSRENRVYDYDKTDRLIKRYIRASSTLTDGAMFLPKEAFLGTTAVQLTNMREAS